MGTAFFACYIQGFFAGPLQRIKCLQQQRGFANAGVAADEHYAAFDHTAAQDTIQLGVTRGCAFKVTGFDTRQHRHLGGFGKRRETIFNRPFCRSKRRLKQGVPRVAMRAFAQPLGTGASAIGANKH